MVLKKESTNDSSAGFLTFVGLFGISMFLFMARAVSIVAFNVIIIII